MQYRKPEVIYIDKSQYGTYCVVDMIYNDRPARMLFGDSNSPQSGLAKDDNQELLFDYNQRFLEIMMGLQPKRALVIGGGVMMLPAAAISLFPRMTIDVVEIDETLVSLAKEYFDLPTDPRLRIHVGDGLEFVSSSRTKYDMIIFDAFHGYSVPSHLVDQNAAAAYRTSLSRKGILAINFISEFSIDEPSLAHSVVESFSSSFKNIELYQSDPEDELGHEQNLLLVASNTKLSLDYLQSEKIEF